MVSVVPLVVLVLNSRYLAALVLFLLAGASDGVDGLLAKRYGWRSRLGAFLDPLADKTLMLSGYTALALQGLVPLWFLILIIARDLVILGGAVAFHFVTHQLEMQPSLLSKVNTVCQMVLVGIVLCAAASDSVPASVVLSMMTVVVVTTLASGVGYVLEWSRKALAGQ
jgi:cardiolipin synthase